MLRFKIWSTHYNSDTESFTIAVYADKTQVKMRNGIPSIKMSSFILIFQNLIILNPKKELVLTALFRASPTLVFEKPKEKRKRFFL